MVGSRRLDGGRTRDSCRTLIGTRSTSSLVRCNGSREIFLILQNLGLDTSQCLRRVDSYPWREYDYMICGDILG